MSWRGTRQHHDTVLAALAVAHDDDVTVKTHIFDAKPHAFHQTHAGAVQETGQQRGWPVHVRQHSRHFVLGHHAGNAPLAGWVVEQRVVSLKCFPAFASFTKAVKFSHTPGPEPYAAPSLGEHSEELMLEYGYAPQDIEQMRELGVIA